jgi:hypothetical protein
VKVAKPVELMKKPTIFQWSTLRRVEGLGSDGVLTQTLDEGVEKLNVNVGTAIPELLRSDAFPWEGECGVKNAVQVKSNAAGKSSRLPTMVEDAVRTVFENWVPRQGKELAVSLRKWWTQERLRYVCRIES